MPLGYDEIRNRFLPHAPDAATAQKHEQVRTAYLNIAELLDQILPDGWSKDLALTNLQQAAMWSNFAVAEEPTLTERKIEERRELNRRRREYLDGTKKLPAEW